MRSISFKLTIAFLLVGLTGSILVAAISLLRTASAFDQFIVSREQQALVNNLSQHYATYGSWDHVGTTLPMLNNTPPSRGFDDGKDFRRDWKGFTLVGADGSVAYSLQPEQIGKKASASELKRAVPIESDGKTVGWLLLAPVQRDWVPTSPEALFLRNITSATLVSALVAAGLALILGGLLAFTLTRSLREMTEATVAIAGGKLGQQVKVRSKDELGELATSLTK